MATKTAVKPKEDVKTKSKRDFVDFTDSKLIVDIKHKEEVVGELEMYKEPFWDNTNGQKGVMRYSRLHIELRTTDGKKIGFEIGYNVEKQNIWADKKSAERKEKVERIEL